MIDEVVGVTNQEISHAWTDSMPGMDFNSKIVESQNEMKMLTRVVKNNASQLISAIISNKKEELRKAQKQIKGTRQKFSIK